MSTQMGIREAKANFSALVKQARRGEVVTITDHGRPVARLVPVRVADLPLEERLRERERRGLLSSVPEGAAVPSQPLRLGDGDLAQRMLREERDGG